MVLRMENNIEAVRHFKSPYAPAVNFVGARLKSDESRVFKGPVYIAGKGLSLLQALQSLCGEAAERDAVFMRDTDETRRLLDANLAVSKTIPADQVLTQGTKEDLGSTGCATHTIFETAVFHAIYELIERYAAWHWWSGALAPTRLERNWPGYANITEYVKRLRRGSFVPRNTAFYCLGRYGPVQTAMTRSEAPDGSQIAVAFAASGTLGKAAQRAFLELLSVELETADLMAGKLNGAVIDRESSRGLVAARQDAMADSKAHLFDADTIDAPKDRDCASSAAVLIKSLLSDGYAISFADLTRPEINLPTYRAMFEDPALQPRFPGGFELSPL